LQETQYGEVEFAATFEATWWSYSGLAENKERFACYYNRTVVVNASIAPLFRR
jgi:hypothetical protein